MKAKLQDILRCRGYVGRGIFIGENEQGKIITAYFIMGRSQNSQNRIFVKEGNSLVIYPFDPSKVEDPSLIIYNPVRTFANRVIVTNGDQTDTIYDYLSENKSFSQALQTRTFEPDSPNYTPRISALVTFDEDVSYQMHIIKALDCASQTPCRYCFSYERSIPATGHFLSTYEKDGEVLPSFTGEPIKVEVKGSAKEIAETIWDALHPDYKVSLYVAEYDKKTMQLSYVIRNKHQQ